MILFLDTEVGALSQAACRNVPRGADERGAAGPSALEGGRPLLYEQRAPVPPLPLLSHMPCFLIHFRKSTGTQIRQLILYFSSSEG